MTFTTTVGGTIEVNGDLEPRFEEILTPEVLAFLTRLHDRFGRRRTELLTARRERHRAFASGALPGFLPETAAVRDDLDWRVAPAAPGLADRRVEITGPTDRKMAVNALNSGAAVWLADHEDALSPTWHNIVGGQVNLADAIRRRIDFTSPEGKEYRLGEQVPTICFRPRGWHLTEAHLTYHDPDGRPAPVSASLVDAGLYVFHNAAELIARGTGPYLYLPKLEHHLEARLWNDVFSAAEADLGLPHGTIRATVLIETITAVFQMEEILYELRDHAAGLNAGRWDYLFSTIKTFRDRGGSFVLPDRGRITMTVPFMRAYTELLVATCHRRGAFAIGGMSAFIPNRRDPDVTTRAFEQVTADKRREAGDGFDGTWVAHPDLVPIARAEFDRVLGDRPNQVDRLRDDVRVTAGDLLDLRVEGGRVTTAGIAQNISVALRYLDSWLRGNGAAAIDNLMEDAATAEISRSQLWQWIHQDVVTEDRRPVTAGRVEAGIDSALGELRRGARPAAGVPGAAPDRLDDAAELLKELVLTEEFAEFLTVPAYDRFLSGS